MEYALLVYFAINIFLAGMQFGDPFEDNKLLWANIMLAFGTIIILSGLFWDWFKDTAVWNFIYVCSLHVYIRPRANEDTTEIECLERMKHFINTGVTEKRKKSLTYKIAISAIDKKLNKLVHE